MIRVHLKIHRSCRQCRERSRDRSSSETHAPNAVSALANKAFKVIVSCLTVWWIGPVSTGLIYLKTGSLAVIKLPGVMTLFSNQITFYCHITTAQVPWWVKFLWACSRQCRKTTDNLPMDRQCKKNNNRQFTYGQTVQKTALEHLQCSRQCKKKKKTAIYIWTDSAKKQQQFTYGQYIFTDCTEDNVQNTHTYTQYT